VRYFSALWAKTLPIRRYSPRQQRLEIPGGLVRLPEARAQAERVPAAVARAVVVQKPDEAAHLVLGVDLRVRGLQPAGRVVLRRGNGVVGRVGVGGSDVQGQAAGNVVVIESVYHGN